ncbi:MAG: LTA synthase family protein, partial [Lachnospiraceae bacterium]
MKKIHFEKLKQLDRVDIKIWWHEKKERREAILERRRNSEFAQKLKPVYRYMNRFSLLCQVLLACFLEFVIEIVSRHSLFEAWDFLTGAPVVFLYNAFLIFVTFSIVYLFKRRVFARILISVFWLFLGVCNGYMLIKRVTPFNAQDLKVASDAVSLLGSYFNPLEMILLVVGITAVVIWVVSMWRRGGQYEGRMHRIVALIGVFVFAGIFSIVTNIAIDKRVVSTYFGNIAFAYEDYGFPYCFSASIFNTGISEPNGYGKEEMETIGNHGKLTQSTTG